MRRTRALSCLTIVAGLSWTCGDSTEPPTPTSIALSAAEVELDAIGANQLLSAQVLDQNGQSMPEEAVSWSSDAEDVASVSAAGRVSAVRNGTARITARSGRASGSADVTVAQAVATFRKVAGDGQLGTVGQQLPQALLVEALDRLGVPVAGTPIGFAVVAGDGSVDPATATTGSNGRASAVWTLGTTSGTEHRVEASHPQAEAPLTFSATVAAGAPASVEKLRGDNQTGASATPLPDSVVVRVLDEFDNPVPGQAVGFAVAAGGGAVSPEGVATDIDGRAATEWTLGSELGANSLEATVASLTLTFSATSVLGPPTSITKQTGDGQSATVGTTLPNAPTVRVTDAGDNPVEGVAVAFGVVEGGGSVTGGQATTDADGLAAVGSWTLGTTAGSNALKASVSGSTFVNFVATATPGPPASLVKDRGDNQTAVAGLAVPEPPTIRVTDTYGNGVPAVSVDFAVAAGGGSLAGADPSTGSDGRAAVGSWTLGPTPGANELTAAASGLMPVVFTATGVAGAASITKQGGDGQNATVATAVPVAPTVRLTDALGNPVAGQEVTFIVTAGGGSTAGDVVASDADGLAAVGSWTLGTTAGSNVLAAQTEGLEPVVFTATGTAGPPAAVAMNDGDGQTGLIGFAVNIPPSARVTDEFGNGVAGVTVSFAVTSGGGSVRGATHTSDGAGVARADAWTLGTAPGTNTLEASASAIGSIAFTAAGVTGSFNIDVRYLSSVTSSQRQTFQAATELWERLLYGDLSDIPVNVPAGSCGPDSPALNETVDDLLILATIEPIDGAGGILGQAGPCFIRSSNTLPVIGLMRFDEADVANLESGGRFDEVIVHEMGHVLGLGIVWDDLGLLTGAGGSDPYFTGVRGIEAFDRVGGSGYTGNKVPVENTGGPGTADGHWRESVFDNELMTGYLDSGGNPLSEVTVASFWDLGYEANLDGAEDFTLGLGLQALTTPVSVRLIDDVWRGPVYVVDDAGRVVGVIRER